MQSQNSNMKNRHSNKWLIIPFIIVIAFSYSMLSDNLIIPVVKAEENRDFYKILGIKRSANDKDIKKAFKKMSLKNHPDKNPGDDGALKRFQDISAAYDCLGDQEKRRKFDRGGEKAVNEQGGGGGWGGFGGMDPWGR